MEDSTTNKQAIPLLDKPDFQTKLKWWFALPSVFHGFLVGGLLFASKLVFYWSNHWEYIIEPPFLFFSFLLIVYSIIAAARAERREYQQYFTYKRALLSGFRVLVIAIALSVFADGILYNADTQLADNTIKSQVEKTVEGFKQINFMKEAEKDSLIKSLKEQQLGSASALIGAWVSKVFANAFFLVFIAIYTRYRMPYAWLNNTPDDSQRNS